MLALGLDVFVDTQACTFTMPEAAHIAARKGLHLMSSRVSLGRGERGR